MTAVDLLEDFHSIGFQPGEQKLHETVQVSYEDGFYSFDVLESVIKRS